MFTETGAGCRRGGRSSKGGIKWRAVVVVFAWRRSIFSDPVCVRALVFVCFLSVYWLLSQACVQAIHNVRESVLKMMCILNTF